MDALLHNGLMAVLAFVVAFAVSTAFTPRLREAALRFGIVDNPDGHLKTQREPVPYLGGLAVALGVLIALALTFQFNQQLLAMLLASAVVLVLGLIDDLGSLSPWAKLAGQALAVMVLIKGGVAIELVFLPSWLDYSLTMLWMLAATNAFNLIDIMDGLSSGVGAIAAIYFAVVALTAGLDTTGFLGTALAGALLGFRRYNAAPAKIYLGDTGSLFCGFLLGALAIANHYTLEHRLAAIVPVLILAVPLFDMLFVMYIRWRRGMPVMLGSPDHVALRLRRWKLSTVATVRLNLFATALLGAAGMAVMLVPLPWAIGILGTLAALFVVLAAWLKSIDAGL